MDTCLAEYIQNLKEAKNYLNNIRQQFAHEPDLIKFYEPTAIEMVRLHEESLSGYVEQETGSRLLTTDKHVDVWVHFEGKRFFDGKGPIGPVGVYLQKLNAACQHVISLLSEGEEKGRQCFNIPVFDLVQTAPGSLKLGLRQSELTSSDPSLPLFDEDAWERLKEVARLREKSIRAFSLILKAMSLVNRASEFEDLKQELKDDIRVAKLLHYTKDLAPTNQSVIDRISFEYDSDGKTASVSIDKGTRKTLAYYADLLKQGSEFVKARGVIRAQDLDNRRLISRPLQLSDTLVEQLECRLPLSISINDIPNYLNRFVAMTGFLEKSTEGSPIRLNVEEIVIENDN